MDTYGHKTMVGWGVFLWLVGYVLGLLLFAFVPPAQIGWYIMPFGIALTLWVLFRRLPPATMSAYLKLAVHWTFIAVLLDWLFIAKALHPADGYYKTDVYIYYALTFILPLIVGRIRSAPRAS